MAAVVMDALRTHILGLFDQVPSKRIASVPACARHSGGLAPARSTTPRQHATGPEQRTFGTDKNRLQFRLVDDYAGTEIMIKAIGRAQSRQSALHT